MRGYRQKPCTSLSTLGLLLGIAGCAGPAREQAPVVAATAPATAASPGCGTSPAPLTPIGNEARTGSTVALAGLERGELAGHTLALVADADGEQLVVMDLDSKQQLGALSLGARPAQLLVLRDGRVLVALSDRAELRTVRLESDGVPRACSSTPTAAPLSALSASQDDALLLASSGAGSSLEVLAGETLRHRATLRLPREPRAIVVDPDGRHAYVAHAVGGRLSTIDLASFSTTSIRTVVRAELDEQGVPRTEAWGPADTGEAAPNVPGTELGCQGFSLTASAALPGRVFAPQVLVTPGDPEAPTQGYGDGNQPAERSLVAVYDVAAKRVLASSVKSERDQLATAEDSSLPVTRECLLPRAAAIDPASRSLLVACMGARAVVAYDARSANPGALEKWRWEVGPGPTGLSVDPKHARAVVFDQFERSLELLDLSSIDPLHAGSLPAERLALEKLASPPSLSWQLGRELFHSVGDARISKDGRACASCHPDGLDDSITWATPDGPRRTILLAGRLEHTAPYAWGGTGATLSQHLSHTFERLSGQGLASLELTALSEYISSLAGSTPPPTSPEATLARGKAIFASPEAGCSGCHRGGRSDGKQHDIGSKAQADRSGSFDTPSLAGLGRRENFFHDGRYATLSELLAKSDGTMGHTKQLSVDDLHALEAYLRSL